MLDALRIIAVVNAAVLGLLCLYLAVSGRGKLGHGSRLMFLGVTLTSIFICSFEGGQIGRPFIWWRLPLLLLTNIVFSCGILLGTRDNWRHR